MGKKCVTFEDNLISEPEAGWIDGGSGRAHRTVTDAGTTCGQGVLDN